MKLTISIALTSCALSLSSCASTIGNLSGLDQVSFEVGKTHKSDVANALGLPASRHAEPTYEYWGYRRSPALDSVIYPVIVTPTHATTRTVPVRKSHRSLANAAVVYTFDANGTLIDVHQSSDK